MANEVKTTFELEPNPFERSFASKEGDDAIEAKNSPHEASNKSSTNKHNLTISNISNISNLNQTQASKLPGITPPLFTPGERRLPPLGLSPGGHLSNPGTPGTNLWNSLLNATHNGQPGDSSNKYANGNKQGMNLNESNMRTGLSPGGNLNGFAFGTNVQGLTTPSMLINSPMTPGLSSLLGLTANSIQNQPQMTRQQSLNQPQNLNLQQNLAQQQQQMQHNLPVQQHGDHAQTSSEMHPIMENDESQDGSDRVKLENDDDSGNEAKKQKLDSGAAKRSRATKRDSKKTTDRAKDSKSTTETKKETKKSKTEDERRKNFLERNRVAASKCRQRKKQLISKMEEELSYYSSGYRELSAHVSQLRDQLITLKGIIVGHKDCTMLVQSVGGFEQLNNIIQQANYVTQIACNTQQNVTSMPSTIPTTLNNPQIQNTIASGYQAPPLAPTQTQAPILPLRGNQMIDQQLQSASGQVGNIQNNSSIALTNQHGLADMQTVASVPTNGNINQGYMRQMNSLDVQDAHLQGQQANQQRYNDGMIEEDLPVV